MKHNRSAQSFQSDNSKLLQAWFNLESALRDVSTEESAISNFYISQTNKPNQSHLFKQYSEFHRQNSDINTVKRPFSSTQTVRQEKPRPLSTTQRPMTAAQRPLSVSKNITKPTQRPLTGLSDQLLFDDDGPSLQFKLPVS